MADFKEWPAGEPAEVERVEGGPWRPRRVQLQRGGVPVAELLFDEEGLLVEARVRNGEERVEYALVLA